MFWPWSPAWRISFELPSKRSHRSVSPCHGLFLFHLKCCLDLVEVSQALHHLWRSLLKQHLKLLALVFALLFSGVAFAQSTATLSGTVTDPSGAVVPGAQITVHAVATGTDRVVKSDDAGTYTVPSLQPGEYSVVVESSGFAKYTIK